MGGFTTEEFERAFVQVYPSEQPLSQECKNFLGFLLTNTPEDVSSGISSSMVDSTNGAKINKCLKTIIGYDDIDYLMLFINHANQSGLTSREIQKHEQFPIFHVVFQMLRNREQLPPASATAKPHSFLFHKKNLERFNTEAASVEPGSVHSRPSEAGVGGGSRRRSSSHRKRKSYRKSKRVRHTPRKQTRRHRHRRSRHRHRR